MKAVRNLFLLVLLLTVPSTSASADVITFALPELDGEYFSDATIGTREEILLPFPPGTREIQGAWILADVAVDSGVVRCCFYQDEPCNESSSAAGFWFDMGGTPECPNGWMSRAFDTVAGHYIGALEYDGLYVTSH
jgi:hypothetical protein